MSTDKPVGNNTDGYGTVGNNGRSHSQEKDEGLHRE